MNYDARNKIPGQIRANRTKAMPRQETPAARSPKRTGRAVHRQGEMIEDLPGRRGIIALAFSGSTPERSRPERHSKPEPHSKPGRRRRGRTCGRTGRRRRAARGSRTASRAATAQAAAAAPQARSASGDGNARSRSRSRKPPHSTSALHSRPERTPERKPRGPHSKPGRCRPPHSSGGSNPSASLSQQ